jgi:hypothetical protein
MDVDAIRKLFRDCFGSHDGASSAGDDYQEAASALRAMRSLFEQELLRREGEGRVTQAPDD